MLFPALALWGTICTICIIALLVQIASFVRIFFIARKPLLHYVSLLFPLAVCIQSTTILLYAQNIPLLNPEPLVITPGYTAAVHQVLARNILLCQSQVALIAVVFIVMFIIEQRYFPRVKQPHTWVSTRITQTMHRFH
jgi:hypothetical protein